jgi:multidrug transporter EmrE-like cation transporter
VLYLLLSILANAAASLLLKISTDAEQPQRMLWAGASVGCYGLAFFAYALCLRTLPVSIAYSAITGGAIVVVTLAAAVLLNEQLTGFKLLGAVLVVAGGTLLVRQV